MKNPNVPKLGLIFTTRWQWSYVIRGGGAVFKRCEIVSNERQLRPVKNYSYLGFRPVRTL